MQPLLSAECVWRLDGPLLRCEQCGLEVEFRGKFYRHNCKAFAPPPCPHLGPAIERDGVTIRVKCGCNGKEHDQPHVAHECALFKRCLPTLIPVDPKVWQERKPESDIYHLCHGCDRAATPSPLPPA